MASKRDQLHAHQFLVQRAVSALVTRETDPEQPPFRRPLGAALGGVALAALLLVGFGVWGLVSPGGDRGWAGGGHVIVEKETGARYVHLDGRLHPVANHTSALLALNRHAGTRSVSRDSLAGAPRGPRIGIPDAPDALPAADRVLGGGWTLCSEPATDPAGAVAPRTALLVGLEPPGGAPLGGRALLVQAPGSDDQHLLHEGHRHRIGAADAATVGPALGSPPAVPVGAAVVDALPAGAPLAPIPVPDAGKPSTAVPGHPLVVGQLAVVEAGGGESQHYLVEAGRLRRISQLQFDIQRAYKPTAKAYGGGQPAGVPLGLIAVAEATLAGEEPPSDGAPPATRPEIAGPRPSTSTCLAFDPSAQVPRVLLGAALPPFDPMTATPGRTRDGLALADRVVVPPGAVAVVEAMPSPSAPIGTVALVTDLGVAHALADRALLDVLGFAGVRPVRVPAGLLARVPQGPGLSHAAAMGR